VSQITKVNHNPKAEDFMSAASRAREAAAREEAALKHPLIPDDVEADPDDIMGQVISWDYMRKVAWFVENRRDICDTLGLLSMRLYDDQLQVAMPKTFGTIRR
jgi:hypothetical protein